MRRIGAAILVALALIIAVPLSVWYQRSNPPNSIEQLDSELNEHAFAYGVIDGIPLILMPGSAGIVLDRLDADFAVKQWPPGPIWEYSGDWVPVTNPESRITADLTSHFGPKVVFGIIPHGNVSDIEIRRDGTVILTIKPDHRGFIHQADDIRYGDQVVFLNSDDEPIHTVELKQAPLSKTNRSLAWVRMAVCC